MQPHFVESVFRRAKKLGLTTAVDTSGHGNKEIWDKVLPQTDYVMLCLKGMDLDLASVLSGVSKASNVRARDFAKYIRDNYQGVKLSLRWVLLKDMTDTDEEIEALAAFAKQLSPVFTNVELLPYHTLGAEKWEMIGTEYPLKDMDPYNYEDAIVVQEKLRRLGVEATLYSE